MGHDALNSALDALDAASASVQAVEAVEAVQLDSADGAGASCASTADGTGFAGFARTWTTWTRSKCRRSAVSFGFLLTTKGCIVKAVQGGNVVSRCFKWHQVALS